MFPDGNPSVEFSGLMVKFHVARIRKNHFPWHGLSSFFPEWAPNTPDKGEEMARFG
jgi:hypothetical protein